MPAAAITAGASALGSVGSAVAGGKGAAKAAKIQQQTAQQQMALIQSMYNDNKSLMMPTYNAGQSAQTQENALLGLGGDPTSAEATLAATPGYQFTMAQALGAQNASAYANGLGNSGAQQKALQQRAADLADTTYNNYVGQLGTVADRGVNAMNGLVSAGQQAVSAENQTSQNAADASSANAIYQSNNLANTLNSITGDFSKAYGSIYGGK